MLGSAVFKPRQSPPRPPAPPEEPEEPEETRPTNVTSVLKRAAVFFPAAAQLPLHAYLVLSADPEKAPRQWNRHTQAFVPVISVPFDEDRLLARVADAEGRLRSLPFLTLAV